MKKISGNKLLVKALKEEGVDTIFGYPGACTIDISDELYKQDYTKVILPRQEVALVHEADAYARSTGKVGVCLVTSGPGATNLVNRTCDSLFRQRTACLLYRAGGKAFDWKRCLSGSRHCRYYQKHYEVRNNRKKKRGSGADFKRGFLHCEKRKTGAGTGRPS